MKKIFLLLGWLPFILFPGPVLAGSCGNFSGPGCECATGTDVPSLACLTPIVVNLINYAFMFLGAVTLLFLLYGAIRFITSGGDPKAVEGARKTMTYAVIGAVLVILSFSIVNIISQTLGLTNPLTNFTLFQQP